MPVGKPITFVVTNRGHHTHEFVLEPANAFDKAVRYHGTTYEADEIKPGTTRRVTWTIPQKGSYKLACHIDHPPTATAAYPTPTPQPLFIDTASEGYSCSNGVCAFPDGNVDTSYAAPITSGGGSGPTPYTWSVVAGSLPAGLSLTPSYGVYSAYVYGTPTTVQTSTFTLQVKDGVGDTARQAFTLTIDPPAPLVITDPSPCCPAGTVGTPYDQNLFATGGVQPVTWSIASGQFPPGLSLDCPSPPASQASR